MSNRNQREQSPWKRLRSYKPPAYNSLVVWIIFSMILAVIGSFLLNQFVQIPEEWLSFLSSPASEESENDTEIAAPTESEILEDPVEPERLILVVNYAPQVVRGDFEYVSVHVVVFDQNGPVINEEVKFEYESQENDSLSKLTDQEGAVNLELRLPEGIVIETVKGSVLARDVVVPVQFTISQGRDVFAQDLDGDGLPDIDEIRRGTDRFNPDTDGDGLSDYDEINRWATDPTVSNRVWVTVAETRSLPVYADVEEPPVIFNIDGNQTFDFIWTRPDDNYYIGFFEGYIDSGSTALENQVILSGAIVYADAELGENLFVFIQDVRGFEIIEQTTSDVSGVESLNVRVFIRVVKQDIVTAETVDEP